MCDQINFVNALKAAKGLGCFIPNIDNNVSMVRSLPLGALNTNDINLVKTYHNSTVKPKVKIFRSEVIHTTTTPRVPSFSSRGPSRFISDIIKLDVRAPGVAILAAFSPVSSPSEGLIV